MVQIIVNNSYSQVIGLDSSQFKPLQRVLSYEIDSQAAYFSYNQFNTRRYLIDTKGFFPTGLLDMACNHLLLSSIVYEIKDLRIKPKRLKAARKFLPQVKPYPCQLNALNAAIKHETGTLSMPTGTGKSLVIALITHKLNVRTLIIVPNLEIKKQLQASFEELFEDMTNITIKNIDSSDLMEDTAFDCLIIDEAHHSAAKTYQNLNKKAWNNIYYRFFVTATPFRSNKDENLLFQALAGSIIFQLSYREAIKEKYIVPIEAYYIEMDKVNNDHYAWAQVYSALVVNNDARNSKIAQIILGLAVNSISTLCLVKEIAHGEALKELTKKPFSNGQDEETRHYITKFNNKKINTLIGTTGVLGEGVDTKPCEYVIIAGLGKAKSAFMQQVGRAVRNYPGKESAKIIIIKDRSHKFTLRHFNEQCKILKDEYNVTPVKLEI